jgi:RHH-type rel operon transcriptional repressor/antitoxin RelB
MEAKETLKTVTTRLPMAKVAELDELAQSQDRDRSYLINEAVEEYLAQRRWMIAEIKKAVAEADAGDFVPDDEMEKVIAKWTK